MKGKKMVFAVILAMIVCLVLIPTCAFADDDQGLSGDNSMAGSSTMDGDNSSGASDDGNGNGAGSSSDDANLNDNGSEAGNGGNDGNVGGNDAGTPGSTEGGTEGGTENGSEGDDSSKGEGEKQPEPSDNEEGKTTSGEESSEDNNVPDVGLAVATVLNGGEGSGSINNTESIKHVKNEQELQDAVKESCTIILDNDIMCTDPNYKEKGGINDREMPTGVYIESGVTITIDLNGKTLSCKKDTGDRGAITKTISNYGNLTIKDSVGGGKVDNVDRAGCPVYNADSGVLTLESGTITRSQETGTAVAGGGNTQYTVWNEGTMTIRGGKVENSGAHSSAICNGFYNIHYGAHAGTLTIEGGEISGGGKTIKNSNDKGIDSKLIINGGTLTNKNGAVVDNRASATLNGGTFNGTIKNISNNFNVGAGIFTDKSLVNEKIDDGAIVTKYGDQYGINDSAYELGEIAANNGDAIEIVSLPEDGFPISDIPEGVKFVNNSGKTLIINGVEVKDGTEYTVPASDPKPAEDNKTETSAAPTASARLYAKYIVLEGKGQQWTDGDLEFVLNSNEVVKVLIDGVEVEFTVAEDGTVTIASAVIEALEAGTHEIQFIFADGSCMTTFTK